MRTFIGSGEAARILGCSRQTVARLAAAGDLSPVGKLAGNLGRYVFDADAVAALAESRRKRA